MSTRLILLLLLSHAFERPSLSVTGHHHSLQGLTAAVRLLQSLDLLGDGCLRERPHSRRVMNPLVDLLHEQAECLHQAHRLTFEILQHGFQLPTLLLELAKRGIRIAYGLLSQGELDGAPLFFVSPEGEDPVQLLVVGQVPAPWPSCMTVWRSVSAPSVALQSERSSGLCVRKSAIGCRIRIA